MSSFTRSVGCLSVSIRVDTEGSRSAWSSWQAEDWTASSLTSLRVAGDGEDVESAPWSSASTRFIPLNRASRSEAFACILLLLASLLSRTLFSAASRLPFSSCVAILSSDPGNATWPKFKANKKKPAALSLRAQDFEQRSKKLNEAKAKGILLADLPRTEWELSAPGFLCSIWSPFHVRLAKLWKDLQGRLEKLRLTCSAGVFVQPQTVLEEACGKPRMHCTPHTPSCFVGRLGWWFFFFF